MTTEEVIKILESLIAGKLSLNSRRVKTALKEAIEVLENELDAEQHHS